jgi:hypothetical protein
VRFYQQIYDLPPTDRPGDDVVDNDERLDKWYEAWMRQVASDASKVRGQQQAAAAPMEAVRKFGG